MAQRPLTGALGAGAMAALLMAGAFYAGPSRSAWAQSAGAPSTSALADGIVDCAGLADAAARLECYDELAQPLLGLDDGAGAQGVEALHRFTGTDDWDSESFEVEAPWRLVWQHQGSILTVELRTAEDELLDVIGNQIGSGGGRSDVMEPGAYRLAVRGIGGWRVQVVRDQQN